MRTREERKARKEEKERERKKREEREKRRKREAGRLPGENEQSKGSIEQTDDAQKRKESRDTTTPLRRLFSSGCQEEKVAYHAVNSVPRKEKQTANKEKKGSEN